MAPRVSPDDEDEQEEDEEESSALLRPGLGEAGYEEWLINNSSGVDLFVAEYVSVGGQMLLKPLPHYHAFFSSALGGKKSLGGNGRSKTFQPRWLPAY